VVVAIENPSKTRMVVDALKETAPDTNIVVAVKNSSQKQILQSFEISGIHLIDTLEILSQAILKEILNCKLTK